MMIEKNHAKLSVIPLKENGELDIDHFKSIISGKPRLSFLITFLMHLG